MLKKIVKAKKFKDESERKVKAIEKRFAKSENTLEKFKSKGVQEFSSQFVKIHKNITSH